MVLLPRWSGSRPAGISGSSASRACTVLDMSDNLRMLAEYSNAMDAGDPRAVDEFWPPDVVSRVTDRVALDRVGTDVRDGEQEWWAQHWGGPRCQQDLGYTR